MIGTSGARASTRGHQLQARLPAEAPTSHEVHPRFDAPEPGFRYVGSSEQPPLGTIFV